MSPTLYMVLNVVRPASTGAGCCIRSCADIDDRTNIYACGRTQRVSVSPKVKLAAVRTDRFSKVVIVNLALRETRPTIAAHRC